MKFKTKFENKDFKKFNCETFLNDFILITFNVIIRN